MYIEKAKSEWYHLKKAEEQVGAFRIMQVGNGIGKIKQLEVAPKISSGEILHIFELIQTYAEKESMQELHVESHSSALDVVLKHQQFQLHDPIRRLWIYRVNHR